MPFRAGLAVLCGILVALLPSGVAQALEYRSTALEAWHPNGQVWAVEVTDTRVYLGGDFTELRNPATGEALPRDRVAALDRATGAPVDGWAPSVDGTVYALEAAPNGNLYAGGEFLNINGAPAQRLAQLDQAGQVVPGWAPDPGRRVLDIEQVDGSLYVAGHFGSITGTYRRGLAKLDAATGALDPAFDAQVPTDGHVQTMEVVDGIAYLGGTFQSLGGSTRRFAGAVDASTGSVLPWAPQALCATCRVYEIDVLDDRVYAAVGGFGGRAVAWSRTDASLAWRHSADGDVQTVEAYDGVVYFGGHFWESFGDVQRHQLAAVDAATGEILDYRILTREPGYPGIWELDAAADALRVGGGTLLRGQPVEYYFALESVPTPPPPPPPSYTTVTVDLSGCDRGCKVRLVQAHKDGIEVWSSPWRRATGGTRAFEVLTETTRGMTVQIRARWDADPVRTSEVVMRYRDLAPGTPVGGRLARQQAKGSACFAGTSLPEYTLDVAVRKVKVWGADGSTTGTLAWTRTTQEAWRPMRKTPKGVLRTKDVTYCVQPA